MLSATFGVIAVTPMDINMKEERFYLPYINTHTCSYTNLQVDKIAIVVTV